MKKKILLVLFVFTLLLVGCSSNTTSNENNDDETLIDVVEEEVEKEAETNKVLIAYFSGTGHSKQTAEYIAEYTGGDLLELTPVEPYTSEDLSYTNDESRVMREHNDSSLQDIELSNGAVDNFSDYDIVFIGYPIWWGDAAWPVFHFVSDNDFANKTVICFASSASSPIGDSVNTLKNLSNGGNWLEGIRFSSSVGQDEVNKWLDSLTEIK